MMLSCHPLALVALLASGLVVSGYEVIEGHYRGKKYEPEEAPSDPFSRFSSAYTNNESFMRNGARGLGVQDQSEGRGTPGVFGKLIRQLSTALHRRIVGSKKEERPEDEDYRGRSLPEDEKQQEKKPKVREGGRGGKGYS